jgi:tRNA-dihydrouridine synthase B
MVGVTDRPFRILCRSYGAALATSEMINSISDCRYNKRVLRRLDQRSEPCPRSAQILSNNPKDMAECACFSVDQGADISDINMGCPTKKVCRKAAGSALLGDATLVAAIVQAMVKA